MDFRHEMISFGGDLDKIKEYIDFLLTRVPQPRDLYGEWHHILPKALFPQYSKQVKENLIYLSAKDHFIAHYLLFSIYPSNTSICHAFRMMFNRFKAIELTKELLDIYSEAYEQAKLISNEATRITQSGKIQSPETIAKRVAKTTGQKRTEEQRATMATSMKGVKRKSPMSEERKQQISAQSKGIKKPEGHGAKVSAAMTGYKKSPEHIQKIKDTQRRNFLARKAQEELSSKD